MMIVNVDGGRNGGGGGTNDYVKIIHANAPAITVAINDDTQDTIFQFFHL